MQPLLAVLHLVVGAASADDLVVSVPSSVDVVQLQCGPESYEQRVPRSVGPTADVRFPIRPGRPCEVTFVRNVGSLTQLGNWSCSEDRCSEVVEDVGPVEQLAPGEVKIIAAAALPHPTVELTCRSGFRQRAPVSDHIARFSAVPDEECELFFKGGAPYHFRPLRWGTWYCSVVSSTLVCEQRG